MARCTLRSAPTVAADPVDEAAGRLYGLPLEEFTRERDATREATAQGGRPRRRGRDRQAAQAQPGRVDDQPPRPRRARSRARSCCGRATSCAPPRRPRWPAEAGPPCATRGQTSAAPSTRSSRPPPKLSRAMVDRLRETLHAAAGDDEVRAQIEAGRLTGEAKGGGAWPLGEIGDVPPEGKAGQARAAKAGGRKGAVGRQAPGGGEAADREAGGRRRSGRRAAAARGGEGSGSAAAARRRRAAARSAERSSASCAVARRQADAARDRLDAAKRGARGGARRGRAAGGAPLGVRPLESQSRKGSDPFSPSP